MYYIHMQCDHSAGYLKGITLDAVNVYWFKSLMWPNDTFFADSILFKQTKWEDLDLWCICFNEISVNLTYSVFL